MTTCNNCSKVWTENGLLLIPDGHEFYKSCPECKTDGYLQDNQLMTEIREA